MEEKNKIPEKKRKKFFRKKEEENIEKKNMK
jgi:hypothetical protein